MKCKFCSKETDNPRFCNSSCAARYNNKHFPKRRKEGSCASCAMPIPRRNTYCVEHNPNRLRDLSKITLGDLCKYKYQRHSRVRQYSRRLYLSSGLPQKCQRCGYDKHIEVCHIKSVDSFTDDTLMSVVNAISNLVALCPNCHWELDNGVLTL